MGMDVSGINPKINKSKNDFPMLVKYDEIPWGERDNGQWNKDQEQYWKEDKEWNEANKGIYFRNNCWWWRPLWNCCFKLCPELIDEETYSSGCYNDGGGLDDMNAIKLGIKLIALIEDGTVIKYQTEYEQYLGDLPDENCFRCNNNNHGNDKKKDCKSCDKTGKRENFNKSYPFDVDNVRKFAEFCIESGGFEIW